MNFCCLSRLGKIKKIQILRKNKSKKTKWTLLIRQKKHEDEKCHQKMVEKKLKRKALAEKNDGLKQSVKRKKKSLDEKALWEKLDNLNKNFFRIKEQKKQNRLNEKPLILKS